ncbi:MAG: hypothetical protein NZ958_06435 [Bacteroidia bacterium]|nr:hypothetical protein [Bacteroidia bacterium]MDW8088745.1 hypothetical protein [Bacteroidia bacterium]
MQAIAAYTEKLHQQLLFALFRHTPFTEWLTQSEIMEGSFESAPSGSPFQFSCKAADGVPQYFYVRTTTFGNSRSLHEPIRSQIAFMDRNPQARFYCLFLREAWFEWDEEILSSLELPWTRLGYEELLNAIQAISVPLADLHPELPAYRTMLEREYRSFALPSRVMEPSLRYYAAFAHLRRHLYGWRSREAPFHFSLAIRTQPHVHSSHLDQYLFRQYPPLELKTGAISVALFWELEKETLFLRALFPPMTEKEARPLYAKLRRVSQEVAGATLPLNRTRATLKGISPLRERQINLLRIECSLAEVLSARSEGALEEALRPVLATLQAALSCLPQIIHTFEA